MTLYELSFTYEQNADLLRHRMRELRQEEKRTTDSRERHRIHQRITALEPLQREMRELTMLCRHYYERSYHKNGKYSL